MKYYKKRKTYKKKRSYKRRSYKSSKPSKRLSYAIKKVVSRQLETKQNQFTSPATFIGRSISSATFQDLLPTITQGTGESNRIGNRIKPVRLTVKIALNAANMADVYINPSPTYFDIYVVKLKNHQQRDGKPTALDATSMFNDDNLSTGYGGFILDGLRPINDSVFNLLVKKRITLSNFRSTNTFSAATAQYNPNRTITFNLTKHLKNTHIFDDAIDLRENDNMWIAIASTQTDGQDINTSQSGTYQFITDFRYKDA